MSERVYPPVTEAQWERILGGRKVRWLVKETQIEWAGKRAVSCGNCKNTKMHGDPRRGWCAELRFMVSLAFTVLCRHYTTEEGEKPYAPMTETSAGAAEPVRGAERDAMPAPAAGVRDASMIAYRSLEWSGRMTRQQKLVMDFFAINPQRDYTRQELADALGLGINVICGRVNELMKEPFALLEEGDRRECRITGESAHALRARCRAEELASA